MPAVREISREADRNNNRFSSIVLGIVKSAPFQMKMKPADKGRTDIKTGVALTSDRRIGDSSHELYHEKTSSTPYVPARSRRCRLRFLCWIPWSQHKHYYRRPPQAPRSRLGCIYVPHGATMDKFTPAKEGSGFDLRRFFSRWKNTGIIWSW